MLNSFVFFLLLRITYSLIFTREKCFWQKQLFVVAVRRLLLPRSSQVFNVRAWCFIKFPLWYHFISLRCVSSHIFFFSLLQLWFSVYIVTHSSPMCTLFIYCSPWIFFSIQPFTMMLNCNRLVKNKCSALDIFNGPCHTSFALLTLFFYIGGLGGKD